MEFNVYDTEFKNAELLFEIRRNKDGLVRQYANGSIDTVCAGVSRWLRDVEKETGVPVIVILATIGAFAEMTNEELSEYNRRLEQDEDASDD